MSRVLSFIRFMRAPTIAEADNPAFGAACLGYAASMNKHSPGLMAAGTLARLTGRRPCSVEIGDILVDGKRNGPWMLNLRPLDHADAETPALTEVLADVKPRERKRARSPAWRSFLQGGHRAVKAAALVRGDPALRAMDPESLGASIRKVVADVEARVGTAEALLLGVELTALLGECMQANAGQLTLTVWNASFRGEDVGSWMLSISGPGELADDFTASCSNMQSAELRPNSSPAMARRFRKLFDSNRITGLTMTYERGDGKRLQPVAVAVRCEMPSDNEIEAPPSRP